MKWPWRKDKRLAHARREQADVKSKTRRREELAQRAEQHMKDDIFGQGFRRALGGRP